MVFLLCSHVDKLTFAPVGSALIVRRLLDLIDDEYLDECLCGFHPETQFLRQGGE